ncbi:MAG: 23S rRNA (adenine(2503)-C(2))-methyltransferase RlmN [Myxococcales bacterium]|nr:23S rRNA (adenine(2503)-C(2))-methyltransferase RlmN [Myxococcales bacterium]MCB9754675.1 23S rRNA (adenine(2503)-C(2))-methyltransferase RlmN [Myxococcales bacterium]
MSRDELGAWLQRELEMKRFRGDQVFAWLHARRVADVEAMTDVSARDRARIDALGSLERLSVDAIARAADGTRKLKLRTADGQAIESVLIPNDDRGLTLCVSSQAGCCLTCAFCATASLGFRRNLATWEIVDQVYQAQDLLEQEASAEGEEWPRRVTNLVFMGMGEPLANYNQVRRAVEILTHDRGAAIAGRRITISSAGLVPAIERFGREGLGHEVGLAISLNATTDEVRDRIMPINTRWKIAELLAAVDRVPLKRRRRVTFEYVLLADVNDSDDDVRRLAQLVGRMRCQINVIPFNPHPHAPFRRPSQRRIDRFMALCRERGLRTFIRTPRGDDIAAACGQLALEGPTADAGRPS